MSDELDTVEVVGAPPPLDIQAYMGKGWRFSSLRVGEWEVWSPDGRHGTGETPEEAMANIDSHILPAPQTGSALTADVMPGTNRFYSGRVRVRADGSEVALDKWHFIPLPGESGWSAPPQESAPEGV